MLTFCKQTTVGTAFAIDRAKREAERRRASGKTIKNNLKIGD